jgi:valyl-tRNA synthetase
VDTVPPEGDGWERDPDVLDTWFSSALWPFATLGWPEPRRTSRPSIPPDVLSTARDILFLWVARMVMMGLEFCGAIPFNRRQRPLRHPGARRPPHVEVAGTGIDPLDLIAGGPRPPVFPQGGDFPGYGADAVRFGLLAMASSQDVRFNEERIARAASSPTSSGTPAARAPARGPRARRSPTRRPRRRRSRTAGSCRACSAPRPEVVRRARASSSHRAALGLYAFVYDDLCDWYLELLKPRLYADDNRAAAELALHVLGETLALAHPVIPFGHPRRIWSFVPGAEGLLMAHSWPAADERLLDAEAESSCPGDRRGDRSCAAGATASARRRAARSPRASRPTATRRPPSRSRAWHEWNGARTEASRWPAWRSRAARWRCWRPRRSTLEAEKRRAADRRALLEAEIGRAESRLANQGFVAKAPAHVVQAERDKLERLRSELEAL